MRVLLMLSLDMGHTSLLVKMECGGLAGVWGLSLSQLGDFSRI